METLQLPPLRLGLGCLNSVVKASQWLVVFEYSCGSSSSSSSIGHHFVCMRRSHAPLEWSQPQWHIHAMVYTGTKEEVWKQKHCSCFFREVFTWFCLMQSTSKELANLWQDLSGIWEKLVSGKTQCHCCAFKMLIKVHENYMDCTCCK